MATLSSLPPELLRHIFAYFSTPSYSPPLRMLCLTAIGHGPNRKTLRSLCLVSRGVAAQAKPIFCQVVTNTGRRTEDNPKQCAGLDSFLQSLPKLHSLHLAGIGNRGWSGSSEGGLSSHLSSNVTHLIFELSRDPATQIKNILSGPVRQSRHIKQVTYIFKLHGNYDPLEWTSRDERLLYCMEEEFEKAEARGVKVNSATINKQYDDFFRWRPNEPMHMEPVRQAR